VVATDGHHLIISYPNPSTCNRMMEPEIKQKIQSMLSEFHNIDIDYMALPAEVFESISAEFLKEWKKDKNQYIKLSPINHPGLRDIKIDVKKTDDFTPDSVKDAMRLMGNDVRVKKGE
jgi:hypothetical protein